MRLREIIKRIDSESTPGTPLIRPQEWQEIKHEVDVLYAALADLNAKWTALKGGKSV